MGVIMPKTTGGDAVQALAILAEEQIVISGVSASSVALGTETEVVRLVADTDCHIKFGGTALITDTYLPADQPEYFRVADRSAAIVSVIQDSAGGFLYIAEMG